MAEADKENARKLFAQNCECVLAAAEASQFPTSRLPEVAFVGRSNVGKSSLINALTNRKNLARASNTPGRTQQIVFFNLGDRLMLADLPGYGHADAPPAERDRWNELIQHYLKTRPALRCVCLLLDSRHGIMANDLTMMQLLDRLGTSYQIILTKLDQVRGIDHELKRKQIEAKLARHPAARPHILMTSSDKQTGLEDARTFLASFAAAA